MRKYNSATAIAALVLASLISVQALGADSAKAKADLWAAERREAELEAQNETQLSLVEQARINRQFRGQLELGKDDNPDVVGAFYELQGTSNSSAVKYGIKLQNKSLMETLKNYNGKRIEVEGKLRNSGKYLLITRIVEKAAGQPRTERRAFGGL